MKTCKKCNNAPCRAEKQRYCKACHAENMRKTRPKHSELSPEAKEKANARSYANTYKKRGLIEQDDCTKCGKPGIEMHHKDYSKPTEIVWLCRECHLEEHKSSGHQV